MVTIPTQLQPPRRPPTIKETKILKEGYAEPVAISPEQSEQQWQTQVEQERTQRASEQVERINKDIVALEQKIITARKRVSYGTPSQAEYADRMIGVYEQKISGLRDARGYAETGQYALSSVLNYAASKTEETLTRWETKRKIAERTPEVKTITGEPPPQTTAQLFQGAVRPGYSEETFRRTGESVPLFQGAVRPGISEKVFRETGISQPSETLQFFMPQLEQHQPLGFKLPYETRGTITDMGISSMTEQQQLAQSQAKQQQVFSFLAGEQQWQKKLAGKTEAQLRTKYQRLKKAGTDSFEFKYNTPHYMQEAIRKGLSFKEAQETGLLRRSLEAERGAVPYFQIADPVAEGMVKTYSDVFDLGISKPTQKKVARIGVDVGTFLFFSPLMKTGTQAALESEFVYDVKRGKFIRKADLKEYLKYKKVGKTIRDKTFSEKMDDVTALMNKLRNAPPEQKIQLSKELKSLLKDTYGSQELTQLIKEYASQNLGVIQPTATKTILEQTFEIVGRVPEMRHVGLFGSGVSAFTGMGQYERTNEVLSVMPNKVSSLLTGDSMIELQRYEQLKDTKQKSLFGLKLDTGLRQVELLKQPQALKQPQRYDTAQASALGLLTGLQTKQPQVLKQPQKTKVEHIPMISNFPGETIPKRPVGFIVPFLRPPRPTAYRKERRVGYNAFYLRDATKDMKAKWVQINSPDEPQSKQSAMDKMARWVDNKITAKGKIKPITQTKTIKGKKKVIAKVFGRPLPRGSGYFGKTRHKFREHKVRKGRKILTPQTFIEKQRYRLDQPGEVKKIHRAKRISSFLLPSVSPQKRGTKKRGSRRRSASSFFRL